MLMSASMMTEAAQRMSSFRQLETMTKPCWTTAPCAYLAVTPTQWHEIKTRQVLKPSLFSDSPAPSHFKLFSSRGAAVQDALQSRTLQSVRAALEPTDWFILVLHLTDKQWRILWMATEEPLIRHGCLYKGWCIYGTLDTRIVAKHCEQMTIDAIGIDAWKDNCLKNCVHPQGQQCAQCKVKDVQVFASHQRAAGWYCSACWHKYLLRMCKATGQQAIELEEN